jgi:hypothetical protein
VAQQSVPPPDDRERLLEALEEGKSLIRAKRKRFGDGQYGVRKPSQGRFRGTKYVSITAGNGFSSSMLPKLCNSSPI